jgi:hypothetical protein
MSRYEIQPHVDPDLFHFSYRGQGNFRPQICAVTGVQLGNLEVTKISQGSLQMLCRRVEEVEASDDIDDT